jgi:hypothetical protein
MSALGARWASIFRIAAVIVLVALLGVAANRRQEEPRALDAFDARELAASRGRDFTTDAFTEARETPRGEVVVTRALDANDDDDEDDDGDAAAHVRVGEDDAKADEKTIPDAAEDEDEDEDEEEEKEEEKKEEKEEEKKEEKDDEDSDDGDGKGPADVGQNATNASRFVGQNTTNSSDADVKTDKHAEKDNVTRSGAPLSTAVTTATSSHPCAMHVFRHISKNGGTTIRFLFDRQTVLGEWEYPIPYGADESQWTGLKTAWSEAVRSYVNGTRKVPPRTLVEVRGHHPNRWSALHFEKEIMDDVAELMKEFGSVCNVTTSFLARKPVDQYASFYDYYIRVHQTTEGEKEASGESTENNWGRSIEDWATRVPDIQTRELLYEDKCVTQLRAPPLGGVYDDDCLIVSDERWARAEAMLKKFDIVGTTDRFDEFLLVLGDITGIDDLRYVFSNTGKSVDKVDKEALAETIKNVTTHDEKLYEFANDALDAIIAKRFGSVERFRSDVLAPFVNASVVVGAKKFIGGKADFTAKYKWVKAEAAKSKNVEPVQLPMWVLPNGGGQATAYMVHEPVVMVDRESAKDIPCIKGCTFD